MATNIATLTKRRAVKLEPPITRDKFLNWDLNHKSFCRQNPEWTQFLPGGSNSTWKRCDEDETQGIKVFKTEMREVGGRQGEVPTAEVDQAATDKMLAALQEFLLTLGSCAPEDYVFTVTNESTSYNWVMNKIRVNYNLNTKGLGFLGGSELKFDIGEDGKTYQQIYQALKEFYCSSLLKEGDIHEGQPLSRNETLTPLGKNFICEKWLDAIHPGLKSHIKNTRGSLFTRDRPSLADNQLELSEMMTTLVQELENNPQPVVNRMAVNQGNMVAPSLNRAGFQPPMRRGSNNSLRRFPQPSVPRPPQGFASRTNRSNCPADTCLRCYEANRKGPSSKNHYAAQCPFPRRATQSQPMRVFLLPSSPLATSGRQIWAEQMGG